MTHRLAGILSDYLSREQMIEKDEADIYQSGNAFVLLCHLQCLEVSQEDTMQPQR